MNTLTLGTYLDGTPAAQEVAIPIEDWRRHVYIVGGTGGGKSNLLRNLMLQRGAFCLIDKEGDLAEEIADAIPCIYWQANDYGYPVGINPWRHVHPDERSEQAADYVAMLSDIWDLGEHTPKLLDYLYAAVRLALENENATPLDLPRILTDGAFRSRYLGKCHDRETKEFWEAFNELDKKTQRLEVSSTLNKVRAFTRSLPLRLAFSHTSIDIRKIMDSGTPLIVNLYGIGEEAQRLLGATIIFQFYLAAQKRQGDQRPDYTLFIDEFEDFACNTMPDILSKSRKRGLSLCIAHQYVSQIPDEIRDAVFANCGTYISFSIGELDAPLLSKVLGRPAENLTGQKTGNAWAAVMHHGRRLQAIPISVPLLDLNTGYLDHNITVTQNRHAHKRADVEYRMSWYERVKWAREFHRKEEKKKREDAY